MLKIRFLKLEISLCIRNLKWKYNKELWKNFIKKKKFDGRVILASIVVVVIVVVVKIQIRVIIFLFIYFIILKCNNVMHKKIFFFFFFFYFL